MAIGRATTFSAALVVATLLSAAPGCRSKSIPADPRDAAGTDGPGALDTRAAGGAGGATGGSAGGSAGGSTAGSGGPGGAGGGADAAGSGGSGGQGGTAADAAAGSPDGAGDAGGAGVTCGNMTCTATEICVVTTVAGGVPGSGVSTSHACRPRPGSCPAQPDCTCTRMYCPTAACACRIPPMTSSTIQCDCFAP